MSILAAPTHCITAAVWLGRITCAEPAVAQRIANPSANENRVLERRMNEVMCGVLASVVQDPRYACSSAMRDGIFILLQFAVAIRSSASGRFMKRVLTSLVFAACAVVLFHTPASAQTAPTVTLTRLA